MDEVGPVESAERVLVDLYSEKGDVERLVGNAQLTIPGLNLDGNYRAVLNRCLRQAEGLGRLGDIVRAAMRDFPDNDALKDLADKLSLLTPAAADIATSAKELQGFLLLLRGSRHLTRREFNELEIGLQRTFDLAATAENDRQDGDIASDQWHDLDQNLRFCVRQFQLYRELVDASMKQARRRVPGASDEHRPLGELVADKLTLIDAKLQLFDALNDVVQSSQGSA